MHSANHMYVLFYFKHWTQTISVTNVGIALTQKMVVRFPFIFECKTSVWYVVKVLEPFEEGDGDTTSVDVQVGDDENVAIDEDFVSRGCGGTVGSLGDDLK